MFHQTAPDTHAQCAVRPQAGRITRLKHLALFALALGVLLTGARSADAQTQTRLYVADYRNSRVAVFDTKAIEPKQSYEQVEATPAWVQTGAQPFGAALSPDGALLYASNQGNSISILDTGNFQNRKDILVPFRQNGDPAMFECAAVVTLPSCAQ